MFVFISDSLFRCYWFVRGDEKDFYRTSQTPLIPKSCCFHLLSLTIAKHIYCIGTVGL